MYYDLHVHTSNSDGLLTRIELLKRAEELNMDYISFTDHDYLDKIDLKEEYEKIYGKLNVKIIDGIEFTVNDFNHMHILGYDIKDKNMVIKELEKLKEENLILCRNLLHNLRDFYGFEIYEEEYKNFPLSKNLIRKMLVDKKYAKTLKEAGDLYTGKHSKFYEQTKSKTYEEVLNLITKAQGIPVFAHPSTLHLDNNELDRFICKLKYLGLQGIEILNLDKTTKDQMQFYEHLAYKHKLFTSCGSDYHNDEITPNFGVKNEKSRQLIRLIERRNNNV